MKNIKNLICSFFPLQNPSLQRDLKTTLQAVLSKGYSSLKSSPEIPLLQHPHPRADQTHPGKDQMIFLSSSPLGTCHVLPWFLFLIFFSLPCLLFLLKFSSSLSSLLYVKIYIHISDPVSQDYITISIYLCSCVSVSLQPKRQQKAMPWVACPQWSLPGAAGRELPLLPMEILPWLSFRSCFLALLFFSLSFSYVLFFGTRFCFLLPERKLESSNNSSRKSPNLSSLKLPFPRKGSFAISNIV